MGDSDLDATQKKAKRLGIPIVFLDESGFSMSPIRGTTWAKVGEPMVVSEVFSRNTQTGFGFITITPKQRRLNFRFTIFDGAINTEDVKMFLRQIHYHYGTLVMIILDRLPSHISARSYFERERPAWFLFEYLPSYSPELNPVEQCWNQMKNVLMPNFVPLSIEHLVSKTLKSAMIINNDPKLIAEFFHHAKLKL